MSRRARGSSLLHGLAFWKAAIFALAPVFGLFRLPLLVCLRPTLPFRSAPSVSAFVAGPGALILIAGRAVSLCFCTSWVFFRSAFVTTGFRCHEERVKRAADVDVATGATVLLLMLSSRRTNESFVSRPLSTNDSSGECCAGYSLRSSFARTMPERISVGPRIAAERGPAWQRPCFWYEKRRPLRQWTPNSRT